MELGRWGGGGAARLLGRSEDASSISGKRVANRREVAATLCQIQIQILCLPLTCKSVRKAGIVTVVFDFSGARRGS